MFSVHWVHLATGIPLGPAQVESRLSPAWTRRDDGLVPKEHWCIDQQLSAFASGDEVLFKPCGSYPWGREEILDPTDHSWLKGVVRPLVLIAEDRWVPIEAVAVTKVIPHLRHRVVLATERLPQGLAFSEHLVHSHAGLDLANQFADDVCARLNQIPLFGVWLVTNDGVAPSPAFSGLDLADVWPNRFRSD